MQNAPAMSAQKMTARQATYGGFGVVSQDMSGNKKPSQLISTGSVGFTSAGTNYYTVNAPALPGDFTLETWVFVASAPISAAVIMGNSALNWDWWIYNNGTVMFYSGTTILLTTTTVSFNSWAHVATVRIGTTFKTYINGVADPGSGTNSTAFLGGNTFIGRDEGVNGYLNGRMTNLRITVGTGLYNSNFTPPKSPFKPLLSTALLLKTETENSKALDSSPDRRTLNQFGAPTWSNASPFLPQY